MINVLVVERETQAGAAVVRDESEGAATEPVVGTAGSAGEEGTLAETALGWVVGQAESGLVGEEISGSVWVPNEVVEGTAETAVDDAIEVVESVEDESGFTFWCSLAWWIVALNLSFSFLAGDLYLLGWLTGTCRWGSSGAPSSPSWKPR